MTADERAVDRLRRQGLRPIPPDEAGTLLDRILRRDIHRVGVIPTTGPTADSLLARFLSLDDRPAQTSRSIPPLSKDDANALPTDRLRAYIEEYVTDAICRIVEVEPWSVGTRADHLAKPGGGFSHGRGIEKPDRGGDCTCRFRWRPCSRRPPSTRRSTRCLRG